MSLSKEEKKKLQQKYKESQKKTYILSYGQVEDLFSYVEEKLDADGCDHTLKHTRQWLSDNKVQPQDSIIEELQDMGGYCDCEVLSNCYEDYDIATD